MKVKKYIGILIATMLLAGFTACGGSDSNDPINPEKPDKPEPELPADYNPIVGEWIWEKSRYEKDIFNEEFEWRRSYLENGKWSESELYRTYKMISKNSFRTSDRKIWKFAITKEYPKDILTLYIGGDSLKLYKAD